MKGMNKIAVVLVSLSLLVCILAFAGFARKQPRDLGRDLGLPKGKGSLRILPYLGEGYDQRPVVVGSLKINKADLSVQRVGLANISSKPVTAVKFGWYLSTNEERKSVLKKGESPWIEIPGGLPSRGFDGIDYSVVSFKDLYKPFVKDGRLDLNFRIEVAVNSILFSDGSTWGSEPAPTPEFRKASLRSIEPLKVFPIGRPADCPGAQCVWHPEVGWSTCELGGDWGMYCPTDCAPTNCCPTLCGYPPTCNCW